MFDDNKKIGIGFCVLGVVCSCLGVILFFDRALLSLGNISFLCGLTFVMGPLRTCRFFFRPEKARASVAFALGIATIMWGWGFVGSLIEGYGVWRLFSAFIPNVVQSMRLIPGMGVILNLPGIRSIGEYGYDQRRLPV